MTFLSTLGLHHLWNPSDSSPPTSTLCYPELKVLEDIWVGILILPGTALSWLGEKRTLSHSWACFTLDSAGWRLAWSYLHSPNCMSACRNSAAEIRVAQRKGLRHCLALAAPISWAGTAETRIRQWKTSLFLQLVGSFPGSQRSHSPSSSALQLSSMPALNLASTVYSTWNLSSTLLCPGGSQQCSPGCQWCSPAAAFSLLGSSARGAVLSAVQTETWKAMLEGLLSPEWGRKWMERCCAKKRKTLEGTKQLKSRDAMQLGQLSAQVAFNSSIPQHPRAKSPKGQPYLLQNNNWSLNQKQYRCTRALFSCIGFPGYWEESLFLCYVNKLDSKYTQEERKMILSRLVAKHLTTKKVELRVLTAACSRLGL